ncbi:MAG: glycosyltransferase [Chitinophagaceae bacterium]|nr:glycosyltransferase [Chitinophagaceae bacterium]
MVRKMDEVAVKKVLYLSYDGMTDPLGQSQVLPYLTGLTKRGYQFTLISFEKEERFIKNKSIIEKICSDNKINWHPLPYTSKPPIFSTIKDLRKLKSQVKKSFIPYFHFDIVHCRSYITALAGLWMKRKWGVKFVFDMRGFWADERVDGNIWKLNNPIFKLVYTLFQKERESFFIKS